MYAKIRKMQYIISPDDAVNILHGVGCSDEVIQHGFKVRELALEYSKKIIANGAFVDINIVEIGSILHDIGKSISNGIEHGALGAKLAENLGIDAKIVQIIRCHIGAGITKKKALELKLPHGNYIPTTIEEKIVAHADNLIKGTEQISINTCILNMQNKKIDSKSIDMIKVLAHEIFMYGNNSYNFKY